jgi:hypothetical protein
MNETQRIRTALLSSLSLHEVSSEDRKRIIELSLAGAREDLRDELAYDVAQRLLDAGLLERVDQFQRDGKPFIRCRVSASGARPPRDDRRAGTEAGARGAAPLARPEPAPLPEPPT